MFEAKILDSIYWVGVNDRRTELFERFLPLPKGVVYNSYLLVDEKTALIDTAAEGSCDGFVERVSSLLAGRNLDYLVINHMEPDHTGLIPVILARYPQVKVVGNKMTRNIFNVYFNGQADFVEVKDGETIDLGMRQLQFVFTPGVHWPETMMTYVAKDRLLFSGDAFGAFGALNGGVFDDEYPHAYFEEEMRRYYVNIVGRYSPMVQKAFAKLQGVPVKIICSTHGPVWRSNPAYVMDCYDRWSRQEGERGVTVAVASMYGATLELGEYLARQLKVNGVEAVSFFDVSATDASFITSEIWKYNGLLLGSVAYNTELYPRMAYLCGELKHHGVANKQVGLFGGCSWSGGGLKGLQKFVEEAKLTLVGEPFEMKGRFMTEGVKAKADALAKALAASI